MEVSEYNELPLIIVGPGGDFDRAYSPDELVWRSPATLRAIVMMIAVSILATMITSLIGWGQ